jgi:hypothetical protein
MHVDVMPQRAFDGNLILAKNKHHSTMPSGSLDDYLA